jgi:hypothetical protein
LHRSRSNIDECGEGGRIGGCRKLRAFNEIANALPIFIGFLTWINQAG